MFLYNNFVRDLGSLKSSLTDLQSEGKENELVVNWAMLEVSGIGDLILIRTSTSL